MANINSQKILSNIFIKLISYIPKGFTWLILIHKKRE